MTALRVEFGGEGPALLRFGFGAGAQDAVDVACPHLAGPRVPETWRAGDATSDDLACVRIEVEDRDIERAAYQAYAALMQAVRPSPHPWLLRIWNYLDDINAGHGDAERYRRFCVGRAAAVDAGFHAPPPAATAIGHAQRTGRLQLIALCTRTPAIALENPRQTPAWQYPREYGPVAPGFSRGALVGHGATRRLLASGTASIVGHVSQHAGDAAAQLRESLANLDVLLDEGRRHGDGRFRLDVHDALRVYLRREEDLDPVRAALAERIGLERVVFVRGDICRRELLVELEGVFPVRADEPD